jgi:hypothetical protein
MGLQLTIGEIAAAFARTYESVDIRTVAASEGGQWQNIVTVIRLGHITRQAVEDHYVGLRERHVDPKNDVFKILLTAMPFSRWDEFCSELSKAEIRHKDCTVQLNRPVELQNKAGYVARSHGTLRNITGEDWPSCEISFAPESPQVRPYWEALRYKLGERSNKAIVCCIAKPTGCWKNWLMLRSMASARSSWNC